MPDVAFGLVRFKKGAYIAMEGDYDRGEFYIIRSGKVQITGSIYALSQNPQEQEAELGPGDFFGVISCMARRPNMDNIVALEDTLAINIKREHFDNLIQKNTAVALKIIRFFSKLLRSYDSYLTRLLNERHSQADEGNPENLYAIGDYFYTKKGMMDYAGYAFTRYLEMLPNGKFQRQVKEKLAKIPPAKIKMNGVKEGNVVQYEDKQVIFLENELGNNLYVIQDGEVKIAKISNDQEVLLDVLKKGDIFGEMAIIENKPRNANAFANGVVRLMIISKDNFDGVVKNYPAIATKIIELLSERIWTIYRQITNMLISNPEIKIFDALYIQLLKNRIPTNQKKSYVFDFGSEDLLKYIGLANEDGWKTWRNIQAVDKNLEITPDGKITCLDISQIERRINVIRREKEIYQNLMEKVPG